LKKDDQSTVVELIKIGLMTAVVLGVFLFCRLGWIGGEAVRDNLVRNSIDPPEELTMKVAALWEEVKGKKN